MKEKKIYIVFCIILIIFSTSLVEKTFQNDTYALIALGRDNLTNKVDGYDHLTFHDNLKSAHTSKIFEDILYNIYETFGYDGIYIFIIILSSFYGIVLYYFLLKNNISKVISFILTLFSIYYSSFIFTARPTLIVMPYFLFIVICIEKIIETNKNKYCIILLISSIFLSNAHGVMWIVHFILYLPFFVEHFLAVLTKNKFSEKKIIIKKYENIKKLLIILILDILSGLLTPLPGGNYLIVKELVWTVTGNLKIGELSTVNVENSTVLIIIITFFLLQFILKHKVRISYIFMIAGLILLSILGVRYGIFLYYIGVFYINKIINLIIKEYNREEMFIKIDKYICKWINLIIIYLCIIIISIKNFTLRVTHEYIYEGDFPIEICDYLKENFEMEDIRVYNHFNFGAYLEFKEIPNFIDGRSGIYYQKYGETSIIDDFLKVSIEGKYEETFSKYDITHVILYNGEKANEKIYNDDNYKILYQTDQFSLYERKN